MCASFRPLAGHGAGSYTFLGLRVLLGSGWVGHQRGWLDAARLGHGPATEKTMGSAQQTLRWLRVLHVLAAHLLLLVGTNCSCHA